MDDLMGKLMEAQQRMEEIKTRLSKVTVEGQAENGLVKATVNGNRELVNLSLSAEILGDREALEDLVVVAVNRAMEQASRMNEQEMMGMAQGLLPGGFPGF